MKKVTKINKNSKNLAAYSLRKARVEGGKAAGLGSELIQGVRTRCCRNKTKIKIFRTLEIVVNKSTKTQKYYGFVRIEYELWIIVKYFLSSTSSTFDRVFYYLLPNCVMYKLFFWLEVGNGARD